MTQKGESVPSLSTRLIAAVFVVAISLLGSHAAHADGPEAVAAIAAFLYAAADLTNALLRHI